MSAGPPHRQRQRRHAAHRDRLGEGPLDRDGLAQPVEPCVPGRRDEGRGGEFQGRHHQQLRKTVEGLVYSAGIDTSIGERRSLRCAEPARYYTAAAITTERAQRERVAEPSVFSVPSSLLPVQIELLWKLDVTLPVSLVALSLSQVPSSRSALLSATLVLLFNQ